jgi:type IV pilus assembly protein PilV
MKTSIPVLASSSTRLCSKRGVRIHRRHAGATVQTGVGLIEVMVAVLVLAIAFLGIAALQAMSLSTNNSAMARSMATIASYSILDAMRADVANAASYNTTVTGNACPTTTTTTQAQAQLGQWCGELAQNLGKAATTSGTVNCTAVSSGTNATADCTITVTFDDTRAGVGGTNSQTVTTRAML